MNNRMKAALIGGVAIGVLSAIPFVNFVNVCCCGWALIGGALATYLYVKDSQTPVNAGDGAMLGLLAGAVGAGIYLILGVPINYVVGNAMGSMMMNIFSGNMPPEQAEAMRQQMEASQSIVAVLINGLLIAFGIVIFSVAGGALGVPIFEKRKGGGSAPPPPPSNFGGTPGDFGGMPPPNFGGAPPPPPPPAGGGFGSGL